MALHVPTSAGEQFGAVVRTRTAGDFLLRLSRYAPDIPVPMHWHAPPYLCLVVHGGIDERCGREPRTFRAGSLHFHPAGEPHGGRMGPEGLLSLSIVPGGDLPQRLAAQGGARRAVEAPRMAALAGRCLTAFRDDDPASDLLVESTALELVAALLRGPRESLAGPPPRWLAGVREYLHTAFPGRVRLRDLAAVARVHEVHLVRAFRRHFGLPPAAYLRRVRVEAARSSLLATDEPIAEIALASGFSSQAHLTRTFSAAIGLAPAAYRRAHGRTRRAVGRRPGVSPVQFRQ